MGNMSFVSFRELRTSTAKIDHMLADDGKIVVTSNGKPKALMVRVSEADFEETLAMLNQVMQTRNISGNRGAARLSSDVSVMSLDEKNAEIPDIRRDRRARSANESLNTAFASARMEGIEITPQIEADCLMIINGELSIQEYIHRVMESAALNGGCVKHAVQS